MNLYPDVVFRSVNEITPEWMNAHSLKGLIVDLDNTLAGYGAKKPNPASAVWIKLIKDAGFTVIVLSNAGAGRVSTFCKELDVPHVARAHKPKPHALLKACEDNGLLPEQTAMVGDQIFTDVLSANRAGLMSVIVEPISRNIFFKFRRNVIEKRFITVDKRSHQNEQS